MRSISVALVPFLASFAPLARAADPLPDEARVRNVAVFVYEGVELLDFAGPGEVFACSRAADGSRFNVYTVAESTEPLVSQGFLTVRPEYAFGDCPKPDLVVLPGGGIPLSNEAVVAWVRAVSAEAEVTLSVCNGALLLAKAGLLDGLDATTHHGSMRSLAVAAPETTVRPELRFVDNGRVVTTAGVSAGIDGALHVVARLLGDEAAREAAFYMEYRWDPEGAAEHHARTFAPGAPDRLVELVEVALDEGHAAALAAWRAMGDGGPAEADLNRAGYALLQVGGRTGAAVRLFRLNTARFPSSANAWDSLADGCEAAGWAEEALAGTEMCLRLLAGGEGEADLEQRLRIASSQRRARLRSEDGEPRPGERWICPPCTADCHDQTFERAGSCAGCGMTLIPKVEYDALVQASGR
ncbi:MAG: DJ-1/PfpI family protein [Planctomycetota bacterium]